MEPDAPGLFSTMNWWLSESDSLTPSRRASGSTEPPGGNGTTSLTGLAGHSCAFPTVANRANAITAKDLETDIACTFQFEHVPRLVRRRDGKAELLENAPRLGHLLGIRLRELPAAEPQAVFQADAHVAAHHRRHRSDEHLVAPGAEHRPVVGVAEEAVRGARDVHHVLGMRADAAAEADH